MCAAGRPAISAGERPWASIALMHDHVARSNRLTRTLHPGALNYIDPPIRSVVAASRVEPIQRRNQEPAKPRFTPQK